MSTAAAACKIPAPVCKHCDLTMVFLGKLPSVQQHPEVQVFRCISCNHVASEETKRASAHAAFHHG